MFFLFLCLFICCVVLCQFLLERTNSQLNVDHKLNGVWVNNKYGAKLGSNAKQEIQNRAKNGKEAEITRDLILLAFVMVNRYVLYDIAPFPIGYICTICILYYIHSHLVLFNYICQSIYIFLFHSNLYRVLLHETASG